MAVCEDAGVEGGLFSGNVFARRKTCANDPWEHEQRCYPSVLGFGRGRYGFSVAAGWSVGAYLKISDLDVAGLDAGIEGNLNGFYDYGTNYLSFDGLLRARLIAWIGSCASGCANKICWGGCFNACAIGCEVCPIPVGGKICLRPGVTAAYNSSEGFSMGIDF